MTSLEVLTTRHAVLAAALRSVLANDFVREADPNADADADYADDQLALAARDLTRAVEALPRGSQPVGWNRQPVKVAQDGTPGVIDFAQGGWFARCEIHGEVARTDGIPEPEGYLRVVALWEGHGYANHSPSTTSEGQTR